MGREVSAAERWKRRGGGLYCIGCKAYGKCELEPRSKECLETRKIRDDGGIR